MKHNHLPQRSDVVVAGAGPVGLVAALVLAQAGVKVLLLEKRSHLTEASKASTFHPPTLSILANLGVLDAMQSMARHVGHIQYRSTAQGILGNLSYDLLKDLTPHPYRKHLEQSKLTPLLLQKLQTYPNASIAFNTAVVGLENSPSNNGTGVNVHVARGSDVEQNPSQPSPSTTGQHTIEAGFLIGADGAHSQVRSSAQIAFEGRAYPGKVLRVMADASLETLLNQLAPVTYLVNESHSASFLHMEACWRIILRVPADVSEAQSMSDGWILERLRHLIPDLPHLPNIIGKDSYGARQCVAENYRKGAVYLMGDSAHLSNTRGGMNMNCGIHDGFHIANAMVKALQDNDISRLHSAAVTRQHIATHYLIPRSDAMVSAEGSWIESVQARLGDPEKSRNYLAQAAMLDMVDLSAA